MNTPNGCVKCDKLSHFTIDIYIHRNFPLNLCAKHKNFRRPNRFIVWLDSKLHLHYKFPKYYMELYNLSYKEAKLKFYGLKHWQKETLNF